MASLKIMALGGLDKKSNDLTRAIEKASDMLNLEYDTQTTIKKRNGYDLVSSITSDDMVYFPSRDEKLFFTKNSPDVFIKGSSYTKTVSLPQLVQDLVTPANDTYTFLGNDVGISGTENMLSYYFTNTDYSIPVVKYDGSNMYRAGLPTPRRPNDQPPTCGSLGSGNMRLWYSFKDINGLTVFSPYYEFAGFISGASTLSINTLKNDPTCEANGFLNRYCWMDGAITYSINPKVASTAVPGSGDETRKLIVKRHNYKVGDKFIFDAENKMIIIYNNVAAQYPASRSFVVLEVESVTLTTIVFKQDLTINFSIEIAAIANIGTIWPINSGKTEWPLDTRTKLHIYSDTASTGVFVEFLTVILNGANITDSLTVASAFVFSPKYAAPVPSINYEAFMEDIYDTQSSKIMPPICKYLCSYGDQIVYANIDSYIDFNNRKIQYNNNDLIIYSDILQGDSCENTSEFNRQKIGETYDGDITGVSRCNDSVVIFKDNSTFTLDGVLSPGQYSIRKINTNGVGCRSHKSIVSTDEGILFQAHNGIYYTNGISVQRLTFELDSFFGSGDFSTVRAVRLKKKQKTIFYIPSKSKSVIIDYYYNQVYLWDGFTPSGGIIEDAIGDVFFSSGTKLYKFSDTSYSDSDNAGLPIAITSRYSTTWHHFGEPSLRKKYIGMRVFALTDDIFNLTIQTQADWSDPNNAYSGSTVKCSSVKSFGTNDQSAQYIFDMITARSMRVVFSNNTVAQNMVLTGYELDFELYNTKDKD